MNSEYGFFAGCQPSRARVREVPPPHPHLRTDDPVQARLLPSGTKIVDIYLGMNCEYSTGWGGHLFQRFCKLLSESSPGCWAVQQLPCCPSKQGELLENI